jgi:Zn-finger nucleic acid-binding protein
MPRCPVCKTQADLIRYEGVPIYNCGSCGGHWLTQSKLDVILARREVVMPDPVKQKMLEIAAAADSRQGLWCMTCAREMVKEPFKGWSEIQLDRCTKCGGLWLDRGELEKCQIFWEYQQDHPDAPGADLRARKAALEAQWQTRQAELRSAAEDAQDAAQSAIHFAAPGLLGRILSDLFG